ncbi:MAG: winged helix-turn-helix transcriptional regulator [Proteobacteria bacterium]|nr:winged helix-turn-helix transcriptional regulator [Pseudomonadota bacterium]
MIKKTDLIIISSLRQNAREKLTEMSRKTRIPVSTIFDRIAELASQQI